MSFLFPDPPRAFRGRRTLKILLRAVHVLCIALLVGAAAFRPDDLGIHLWTTIGSGALILLLDLHETAAFLFQVRGLIVVAKIAALGTFHLLSADGRLWLLGGLALLSVVSSHAPGSIRHRVVFGKAQGAQTSG